MGRRSTDGEWGSSDIAFGHAADLLYGVDGKRPPIRSATGHQNPVQSVCRAVIGRSWLDPEEFCQVSTEVEFSADIGNPSQKPAPKWDAVICPRRRDFNHYTDRQSQALIRDPEDQNTLQVRRLKFHLCGESVGPLLEVARRRGRVEELSARRSKNWAIVTMDELGQFRARAVTLDANPVPTIGRRGKSR